MVLKSKLNKPLKSHIPVWRNSITTTHKCPICNRLRLNNCKFDSYNKQRSTNSRDSDRSFKGVNEKYDYEHKTKNLITFDCKTSNGSYHGVISRTRIPILKPEKIPRKKCLAQQKTESYRSKIPFRQNVKLSELKTIPEEIERANWQVDPYLRNYRSSVNSSPKSKRKIPILRKSFQRRQNKKDDSILVDHIPSFSDISPDALNTKEEDISKTNLSDLWNKTFILQNYSSDSLSSAIESISKNSSQNLFQRVNHSKKVQNSIEHQTNSSLEKPEQSIVRQANTVSDKSIKSILNPITINLKDSVKSSPVNSHPETSETQIIHQVKPFPEKSEWHKILEVNLYPEKLEKQIVREVNLYPEKSQNQKVYHIESSPEISKTVHEVISENCKKSILIKIEPFLTENESEIEILHIDSNETFDKTKNPILEPQLLSNPTVAFCKKNTFDLRDDKSTESFEEDSLNEEISEQKYFIYNSLKKEENFPLKLQAEPNFLYSDRQNFKTSTTLLELPKNSTFDLLQVHSTYFKNLDTCIEEINEVTNYCGIIGKTRISDDKSNFPTTTRNQSASNNWNNTGVSESISTLLPLKVLPPRNFNPTSEKFNSCHQNSSDGFGFRSSDSSIDIKNGKNQEDSTEYLPPQKLIRTHSFKKSDFPHLTLPTNTSNESRFFPPKVTNYSRHQDQIKFNCTKNPSSFLPPKNFNPTKNQINCAFGKNLPENENSPNECLKTVHYLLSQCSTSLIKHTPESKTSHLSSKQTSSDRKTRNGESNTNLLEYDNLEKPLKSKPVCTRSEVIVSVISLPSKKSLTQNLYCFQEMEYAPSNYKLYDKNDLKQNGLNTDFQIYTNYNQKANRRLNISKVNSTSDNSDCLTWNTTGANNNSAEVTSTATGCSKKTDSDLSKKVEVLHKTENLNTNCYCLESDQNIKLKNSKSLDKAIFDLLNLYPKCFELEKADEASICKCRQSNQFGGDNILRIFGPTIDESILLAYDTIRCCAQKFDIKNLSKQKSESSFSSDTIGCTSKWMTSLPNILYLLKWLKKEYQKLQMDVKHSKTFPNTKGAYSEEVLTARRYILDCLADLLHKKRCLDLECNSFDSRTRKIRSESGVSCACPNSPVSKGKRTTNEMFLGEPSKVKCPGSSKVQKDTTELIITPNKYKILEEIGRKSRTPSPCAQSQKSKCPSPKNEKESASQQTRDSSCLSPKSVKRPSLESPVASQQTKDSSCLSPERSIVESPVANQQTRGSSCLSLKRQTIESPVASQQTRGTSRLSPKSVKRQSLESPVVSQQTRDSSCLSLKKQTIESPAASQQTRGTSCLSPKSVKRQSLESPVVSQQTRGSSCLSLKRQTIESPVASQQTRGTSCLSPKSVKRQSLESPVVSQQTRGSSCPPKRMRETMIEIKQNGETDVTLIGTDMINPERSGQLIASYESSQQRCSRESKQDCYTSRQLKTQSGSTDKIPNPTIELYKIYQKQVVYTETNMSRAKTDNPSQESKKCKPMKNQKQNVNPIKTDPYDESLKFISPLTKQNNISRNVSKSSEDFDNKYNEGKSKIIIYLDTPEETCKNVFDKHSKIEQHVNKKNSICQTSQTKFTNSYAQVNLQIPGDVCQDENKNHYVIPHSVTKSDQLQSSNSTEGSAQFEKNYTLLKKTLADIRTLAQISSKNISKTNSYIKKNLINNKSKMNSYGTKILESKFPSCANNFDEMKAEDGKFANNERKSDFIEIQRPRSKFIATKNSDKTIVKEVSGLSSITNSTSETIPHSFVKTLLHRDDSYRSRESENRLNLLRQTLAEIRGSEQFSNEHNRQEIDSQKHISKEINGLSSISNSTPETIPNSILHTLTHRSDNLHLCPICHSNSAVESAGDHITKDIINSNQKNFELLDKNKVFYPDNINFQFVQEYMKMGIPKQKFTINNTIFGNGSLKTQIKKAVKKITPQVGTINGFSSFRKTLPPQLKENIESQVEKLTHIKEEEKNLGNMTVTWDPVINLKLCELSERSLNTSFVQDLSEKIINLANGDKCPVYEYTVGHFKTCLYRDSNKLNNSDSVPELTLEPHTSNRVSSKQQDNFKENFHIDSKNTTDIQSESIIQQASRQVHDNLYEIRNMKSPSITEPPKPLDFSYLLGYEIPEDIFTKHESSGLQSQSFQSISNNVPQLFPCSKSWPTNPNLPKKSILTRQSGSKYTRSILNRATIKRLQRDIFAKRVRFDPNIVEPKSFVRKVHSSTNGQLLKLKTLANFAVSNAEIKNDLLKCCSSPIKLIDDHTSPNNEVDHIFSAECSKNMEAKIYSDKVNTKSPKNSHIPKKILSDNKSKIELSANNEVVHIISTQCSEDMAAKICSDKVNTKSAKISQIPKKILSDNKSKIECSENSFSSTVSKESRTEKEIPYAMKNSRSNTSKAQDIQNITASTIKKSDTAAQNNSKKKKISTNVAVPKKVIPHYNLSSKVSDLTNKSTPTMHSAPTKWSNVIEMAEQSFDFLKQKLHSSRQSNTSSSTELSRTVRYALARIFDYHRYMIIEVMNSTSKKPKISMNVTPKLVFTVAKSNKPERGWKKKPKQPNQ